MKTLCEEMNSRLNILFVLIVITWEEVLLSNIKQEDVSSMKQQLQHFLFPPQNLQSSQISKKETEQIENKQDINKEPCDAVSYEVDTPDAKRRSKRSSTNDQIYVLMPLHKNTRKIRSNLRQQHMVKLDLARTDIPWDVPDSVVLDDGIRKICLDVVTSSPKKRKKSDNNLQYSEEDFNTNKLGKEQAKLLLYPNQVISDPKQGGSGCCPTTACTTPKPPICLNIHLSNVITPDMVCKTKIYNSSQIDPNGNVRLSVVFFNDDSSNLPGQSFRKSLSSSQLSSKQLTQMLQGARFDNFNKINNWMKGSNIAPDKRDKNADQNDSIKSLFQITENNEKNSSNTYINNDQLSQSQIIQNSFKSANSPSASLKEGQSQVLSNTVEALSTATNKSHFDGNEVNTTLALRTLLGLIQLMQVGNNNHEIQHTPQDTVNRLY